LQQLDVASHIGDVSHEVPQSSVIVWRCFEVVNLVFS
jgi:hypothetical protein